MPPETVAAVIEEISKVWRLAPNIEISLEANPTSVEAGRFAGYADAGVNRVSMGIQSLHDADLKALGRMHTVAEARAAFDVARNQFKRVSFDLIYARQGQTVDAWEKELTQAIDMAVDHLSLYQLTIEDGTRFGDLYARGKLRNIPDDSSATDMYFRTQEVCEKMGLPSYETSNHARSGAESRHNLIYWRYGDYVGIGPGAHGRITINGKKLATETFENPDQWLTAVNQTGWGRSAVEEVSAQDQASEYLMMSLRLAEGTDLTRYASLNQTGLLQANINELVNTGFVTCENDILKATRSGKPVLNAVLRQLLVD